MTSRARRPCHLVLVSREGQSKLYPCNSAREERSHPVPTTCVYCYGEESAIPDNVVHARETGVLPGKRSNSTCPSI